MVNHKKDIEYFESSNMESLFKGVKEYFMCFDEEIVLGISDSSYIDVDFRKDILPAKVIVKDQVIVLGRKASRHKWMHKDGFCTNRVFFAK